MHANDVLLVKPKNFNSNPETSGSNSFQQSNALGDSTSLALREFELLQKNLEDFGVVVNTFKATSDQTPDAIFPNNWFSMFEDKLFLYPMLAPNRRLERRMDIINYLQAKYGPYNLIDLTGLENSHQFLEGTGSLIFDRNNKNVFCALSPRATHSAILAIKKHIPYEFLTFVSLDSASKPIYHTNVMMSLGNKTCAISLHTIANSHQRAFIHEKLSQLQSQQLKRLAEEVFAV